MDDIAECAGVSKPVLYQHFPGKFDLYLALLGSHCDALTRRTRTALASTPERRARVDCTVHAFFEFVDHDHEAFQLVFETDLGHEPAIRDRIDRMIQDCAGAVADAVLARTDAGRNRAVLLAAGMVGVAVAAARFWVATGRSTSRTDTERIVAGLILQGLDSVPEHRPDR